MPWKVIQKGDKYRLRKIDGTYVKKYFNTRESAINSAKNYARYLHEKPIVKGDWVCISSDKIKH